LGPEAILSDPNSVRPSVSLADTNLVETSLLFELTVTDTGGLKAKDSVIVNIISNNLPPKADAGLNRSVNPHEEVMLDGLNSHDSDGAIVSYEWKQIKGPALILSQPNNVRATFLAPEVDDEGVSLIFELTVSDRDGLRDNATMMVNVIKVNVPPIAKADGLQSAMIDEVITLNSSDSNDSDGYIAAYHWKQLKGPQLHLSDPSTVSPTFSWPGSLDECASFEFELTVTDNGGLADTDTAFVNICNSYLPPVATAGSNLIVEEGDTVTLDAIKSHALDNHALSYEWKQIAGPQVILSNAGVPQPTFIAPEVNYPGTELIFQLGVRDGNQLYDVSTVSVFVQDSGILNTLPGAVSFKTHDSRRLRIKCSQNASLVKLDAMDPREITEMTNRPQNLIYGLVDIQIKVAIPGDEALATVCLLEPAPVGYSWFKWDRNRGWFDYGKRAAFNAERDCVTLTLTDGGEGDDDNMLDGIIKDPGGLGTPAVGENVNIENGGGGGGGCFIGTSFDGLHKIIE
jgi:hypothetical protein